MQRSSFLALGLLAACGADPTTNLPGAQTPACGSECFEACQVDPAALEAELGEGLTAVGHLCLPLGEGLIAAHQDRLFHATSLTERGITTLTLDTYRFDVGTGAIERIGDRCTAVVASRLDPQVRLVGPLGVSASGALVHFGIQVNEGPPNYTRLFGRAYAVRPEDCEIMEQTVDLYGGSVIVSEDPAVMLVSAIGPSGAALFRGTQEVASLSVAFSVARYSDQEVLAAIASGHGAVGMMLYPSAELLGGPYPVRGIDSDFDLWPARFVVAEGRGIIGRSLSSNDTDPHQLYAVTINSEPRLIYTEPRLFASSFFSEVAPIAGTQRLLLAHPKGLLVVE